MSKNLLLEEAQVLSGRLKQFFDKVYSAEEDWTSCYDPNDPNDQYIRNQLYKAAELMRQAYNEIDTMLAPVAAEGVLTRNNNGRFMLVGRELSSGYPIEYLVKDDFDGIELWRRGRIEHYDGDYRIWNKPEIELEGLRVRIKA